jgi:predicted N-acyltransferase
MLGARRYLQRTHRQFHWENAGYDSFEGFLGALSSRKRKTIRRERADALQNGVTVHQLTGADLTETVWDAFFEFYMDTGSRKWGRPYLTHLYSIVSDKMRDRILLVMARREGAESPAPSISSVPMRFTATTGAPSRTIRSHFEVCCYRAIDYAIALLRSTASKPARVASTRSRAAICR